MRFEEPCRPQTSLQAATVQFTATAKDASGLRGKKHEGATMAKKLFVGGLSFNTTEESLRQAFSSFGTLVETKIITDRDSGRSRGFGFVSFDNDDDAEQALQKVNGTELDGRTIRVDQATDRERGGRGGQSRRGRGRCMQWAQ
jgi:RNA recognition motif-containing protein